MSDIIGIIATVEDDEYPPGKTFKKVTLGTGQVLKVKHGREDALCNKWGLLQEGVAIKFIMKDYATADQVKIPFVFDIETVESALLEAQEPAPLSPEQEAEIDKALKPPPNPQAVGMCTKEIGDMIRSKYLKPLFGDIHIGLIKWYQGQILDITRIPFDKAELPQFKTTKRLSNEVEPDDVPF